MSLLPLKEGGPSCRVMCWISAGAGSPSPGSAARKRLRRDRGLAGSLLYLETPQGSAGIYRVAALMRIPVMATAELVGCAGGGNRSPKARVPPAACVGRREGSRALGGGWSMG